ncbi:MAG: hypothetical protein QXE10_00400 [Desulfurococcaceae archaeon]|jgi:hypothetical protein
MGGRQRTTIFMIKETVKKEREETSSKPKEKKVKEKPAKAE